MRETSKDSEHLKPSGAHGAPSAYGWAALVSGTLCIAAAIQLIPSWLAFVFKPATTLLIIAYACQYGDGWRRNQRFVIAGLILSLAGDVFLLWPEQGFLFGLVSFLLAHLLYIGAFCGSVRFAARPIVFLVYGLVAAAILSQLWDSVPSAMRIPVVAYVICLASMAAQAAAWWRSMPSDATARRAAAGGVLFMASDTLLAFNKFSAPLPLSALWILATYWAAQWCIAGTVVSGRTRPDPNRHQAGE